MKIPDYIMKMMAKRTLSYEDVMKECKQQDDLLKDCIDVQLPGLPAVKVKKISKNKYSILVNGRDLTDDEKKRVLHYIVEEGFVNTNSDKDDDDEPPEEQWA